MWYYMIKKSDLTEYKDSKQHFILFDIYLKEKVSNKEKFMIEIGITQSAYRKCRKGELVIGLKIIEQLANHFSLKIHDDNFLDDLVVFFDKVYNNMYYKIYTSYEEDLKYLDELINTNYVFFPVLKLFKLFLLICTNKEIRKVQDENISVFREVEQYKLFFNNSVYEIFESISLIFIDEIPDNNWIKNYNNASAYYILSTRCAMKKRYLECLFFANKAKLFLEDDGNINRLLLNHTIMNCLLNVGNYEECYDLASKQFLILQSIGRDDDHQLKAANKFISISLLGLQKYKEVVVRLDKNESYNMTELCCFLIAKYKMDKKEYCKYYNELDVDLYGE